jgi:hypothetical protein
MIDLLACDYNGYLNSDYSRMVSHVLDIWD